MKRPSQPPKMLQHFPKEDKVEGRRRDYSYNRDGVFVWFPATVLRPSSTRSADHPKTHIYLEFETLRATATAVQDGGDCDDDHDKTPRLREYVELDNVRPVPPQELHRIFKIGEFVEAFCGDKNNRGWRKAKVLKVLENSKYAVAILVDTTSIHDHDNDDDDNGRSIHIVEEAEQLGLRVLRDWDDGFWVSPLQIQEPHFYPTH